VWERRLYERGRRFFETTIWSVRAQDLDRGRALLYRMARAFYATMRGFFDKELTSRAASLTYYTMLSIVPFLAFAFSLLKGFGIYRKLMQESLRPYLRQTFAGDQALLQGVDQTLAFVERTSVSGLSVIGVLFLMYTSVSMLSTVEASLNGIWEVRTARPLVRKVTDYTTILVIGPLLGLAAVTITAAAQNSTLVAYLHRSLLIGDIVDVCMRLASAVLGCVGLVAVYLILPNARVRFSSAVFGGVVAGLLWQGALMLHVRFQVGVAKYNALYSGFAAVPIFLVWVYVSWTLVLVGAQLAASHQYEQRMWQALRARHVDQELREHLAVVLAAAASRSFIEGHAPPTSRSLATALEVPPPAVDQVLEALVQAKLLVRVGGGDEARYAPARDLDGVRLAEVEEAVRHDPSAEAQGLRDALERTIGADLTTLLRARDDETARDSGRLTLRELAPRCPPAIDGVTMTRRPSPPAPADGKAPDA
jgi:membrane protein